MFIRLLLCVVFSFLQISISAYELLSSKTTVSPVHEGGVLSRQTISFISKANESNEPNFDDESLYTEDNEEAF